MLSRVDSELHALSCPVLLYMCITIATPQLVRHCFIIWWTKANEATLPPPPLPTHTHTQTDGGDRVTQASFREVQVSWMGHFQWWGSARGDTHLQGNHGNHGYCVPHPLSLHGPAHLYRSSLIAHAVVLVKRIQYSQSVSMYSVPSVLKAVTIQD